jgi:hypothetical protein
MFLLLKTRWRSCHRRFSEIPNSLNLHQPHRVGVEERLLETPQTHQNCQPHLCCLWWVGVEKRQHVVGSFQIHQNCQPHLLSHLLSEASDVAAGTVESHCDFLLSPTSSSISSDNVFQFQRSVRPMITTWLCNSVPHNYCKFQAL